MTKAADDFNSIARRLQEIEAEKMGNKWADLPPYTPKQVNG